jgi:hypothetical protein
MKDKTILLTTFLRFESVKNILEILREIEPKMVIVTSDGPRKLKEKIKIDNVRELILSFANDINIITLFSETNKGILSNLYSALEYAFYKLKIESVIFIEDDVFPTKDYFLFSSMMLDYFRDNTRIKVINGHNLSTLDFDNHYDYFYNKRLTSTAHAYWRRTYDELRLIKSRLGEYIDDFEYNLTSDRFYRAHLKSWFKKQKFSSENVSYELLFTILFLSQYGLAVTPKENLLKLGGLDTDASNSLDNISFYSKEIVKMFSKPSSSISLPINHPPDEYYFEAYDVQISKQLSEGRKLKSILRKVRILFLLILKLRFKAMLLRILNLKKSINKNGGQ